MYQNGGTLEPNSTQLTRHQGQVQRMDPGTKVSVEDRRGMASNPMESLSLAQDDPEVKRSTTVFSFDTKDKRKEKERENPTNQLLEH